jgi:hypothetical protein
MSEPSVVDNRTSSRFELEIDGDRAELVYRKEGDRLVLVHTEVPDELEGHGLGGLLVRAALARATAEQLTIVPKCNFARGWLENHPEEAAAAPIEW